MRTVIMLTTILMLLALACMGKAPQPADGAIAISQSAAQAEPGSSAKADVEIQPEATDHNAGPAEPVPQADGQHRKDDRDEICPETVTVTGRGTVAGPPDVVRLSLSAVSRGQDPTELAADVMGATAALTQAARRNGIAPEDIRTSAFRILENFTYDPVEHRQRREGFEATQQTRVTVRKPDLAGAIMAELIEAAGKAGPAEATVQGVTAELEDPETLRLEALRAASKNMWEQARTVAETSNREICRLLESRAGGTMPPYPPERGM